MQDPKELRKTFEDPAKKAIFMLKNSGRYEQLVEAVKKELQSAKSTASLTEKYKKACEVVEASLTAEEVADIEKFLF